MVMGELQQDTQVLVIGSGPGGYAAAFRAAVDAAHLEGSRGSETEVLVMTDEHTFRIKWRYGRDPYPPT